jgi:hypothetical protein
MVQPVQHGQQKKGLGAVAWIAIGCVGILVLSGIAVGGVVWYGARKAKQMAEDPTIALEMMAALNPEVEVVGKDRDAGTITIRDKKSGQTMTVNMDDLQQGKISFTNEDGSTGTIDVDQGGDGGLAQMRVEGPDGAVAQFGGSTQLPGWVPSYPGAATEGVYTAQDASTESGSFTVSSTDGFDQVFGFYRDQLQAAGYQVTESRFDGPQGKGGIVAGEMADGSRTVTLTLSVADGKTNVLGGYQQKKG